MADRTFGPTVVAGLLGGGLVAVAGNRDWVRLDTDGAAESAATVFWSGSPGVGQMPLAGALGLVVLAAWGVLLVTRGAVRRVAAVVAALASLGAGATWVVGLVELRDDVTERVEAAALPGTWSLELTGWFTAAAVGAVIALAASVVAVLRVGSWPAMGSRYDAPAARAEAEAARTTGVPTAEDLGEVDPTDLWKAIDEGRDPTSGDGH